MGAVSLEGIFTYISTPNPSRPLAGSPKKIVKIFAIVISLYHIVVLALGTYNPILHNIVHLGAMLAITLLTYSYSAKAANRIPVIDILLALVSLGIMGYLYVNGLRLIQLRMTLFPGTLTPLEIGMGAVLMLMLFEAARRCMGFALAIITLLFLSIGLLGSYLPGIWQNQGFSILQTIDYTVFTDGGLFGVAMSVSSTYIILFLIFGAMVQVSGAGEFFSDLAQAVAGGTIGGPGKVAVIGSALYGTMSGSAAANVAVTGSVTIPMMKKYGYQPYVAAAIESTASIGGIIMPPIMGNLLFIMSELAGVRYWNLALICATPAVLYFLGLFVQVHAHAVKNGIRGVEKDVKLPSIAETLKKGWQHIIPFVAIITFLGIGLSPIRACLYSMPLVIAASWVRKETRIGFKEILYALEASVMMIRMVAMAIGLAGIMMAAVFWTGFGSVLTTVIRGLVSYSMLPALLLTALFCMILGLALSSIVTYLLTAILIVPSALTLGIPVVAAHLFAVYYATVSLITPPVGGVFFQAAAMAEAPAMKTGWQATKFAFAGFIVPFIWIYHPGLLLNGSVPGIVLAMVLSFAAVPVMAFAIEGYFIRKLYYWERLLLIIGSFSFAFGPLPFIAAGFGLVALIMVLHWLRAKRAPGPEKATS